MHLWKALSVMTEDGLEQGQGAGPSPSPGWATTRPCASLHTNILLSTNSLSYLARRRYFYEVLQYAMFMVTMLFSTHFDLKRERKHFLCRSPLESWEVGRILAGRSASG